MKNNFIYGIHTILSLLENKPDEIKHLFLLAHREDEKIKKIIATATQHQIAYDFLSRKELINLVGDVTHQGVVAQIHVEKLYTEDDLLSILHGLHEPPFLLILDGIQDPHNLGACLRTANAAGVHAVIAPKDRSASLTPTARKIASGAVETLPFIRVTNLARTMRFLREQNIWLYGMAEEANQNIFDADLTGAIALVLGAEGSGLRRLTRENCDALLAIPMCGSIPSLNVSVATGICLFEAVRQKRD